MICNKTYNQMQLTHHDCDHPAFYDEGPLQIPRMYLDGQYKYGIKCVKCHSVISSETLPSDKIPIDKRKLFPETTKYARSYHEYSKQNSTPFTSIEPCNFNDQKRKQLFDIINEFSFIQDDVILSSGKSSNLYFDMKVTMFHHIGSKLSACAICDLIKKLDVDCIGGLEMGAVPMIASTSTIINHNVQFFFVRKQNKDYGSKKIIEGLPKNFSLKGKRVVIVDDVTTTGSSAIQAVEIVRAEGAIVEDLITIVDRQEGAREAFEKIGITLHSIFQASEFYNKD